MATETKQTDTRVFMYRAGEARLFDSPADVPQGEGWQDTPVAEAVEVVERPKRKAKKDPADGDSA